MTASVAGAALAVAGPDHSASLAAPQQAPTVVLEREYEDTVVVVGGPTTTRSALAGPAAARIAGTTTNAPTTGSVASGAGPAAPTTGSTGNRPAGSVASAAGGGEPAPTTSAAPPAPTTRPAAASPTTAPATTVPTTTVPAQSRAYSSSGGTFTLTWTSRAMTVSAVNPAPGYRARVEGNGTKEIHLVFSSSTRDLEIQITLQGDQPLVQGL